MAGGWSSHLEFRDEALRVRTDFFTRPPRLAPDEVAALWRQQAAADIPVIGLKELAQLKKTNREKDYAIIGEAARLMEDVQDQALFSRSARDLLALAEQHPDVIEAAAAERPALSVVAHGREALEAALDAERRELIHENERRLETYMQAAEPWSSRWPEVARRVADMELADAHHVIVEMAENILPFQVE
jgi:hypothetical protein